MVFAEKFLLESGGLAFINKGGRESLGPPVGGIMLAQPGEKIRITGIKKSVRKSGISFFMKCSIFNTQCAMFTAHIIICKHNRFKSFGCKSYANSLSIRR
jgi:hypothetical protein